MHMAVAAAKQDNLQRQEAAVKRGFEDLHDDLCQRDHKFKCHVSAVPCMPTCDQLVREPMCVLQLNELAVSAPQTHAGAVFAPQQARLCKDADLCYGILACIRNVSEGCCGQHCC